MRMLPTRATGAAPATIKKQVSNIKHVGAPLKGLSLANKMATSQGDPQTATILQNFVIEDDHIEKRAGYLKAMTHADGMPIETLVPWYGASFGALLAATNGKLADAFTGADRKTGFGSNDWSWTSFANLGAAKYTVMVNGADGVWSWDGGTTADQTVAVVKLSHTNPATVEVAPADIAKFVNGQPIVIAGADAAHAAANGIHTISLVGTPANTFTLADVDLSLAGVDQTVGVTATVQGSFAKQPIGPDNAADTWIVPDQFQLVLTHMNRLWFADSSNLAVYYLPLQQMSGKLRYLPLNALFKRGGSIRAMYTWTVEGGTSTNDQLVIMSTNGEAVIYQGVDPDDEWNSQNWSLSGIFRFDTPVSKNAMVNYGGELYVLVPTGLVPMSALLQAEQPQLGNIDQSVLSIFLEEHIRSKSRSGWQAIFNPNTGRVICNMPTGSLHEYRQLVRHMPRPVWSEFRNIPSRCWAWLEPYMVFGDDDGSVYRFHPDFLSDDGNEIVVDVQCAWSLFGTPAVKQFKMAKVYLHTDGNPKPVLDVKTDYDFTDPKNQPDISFALPGAVWDVAAWDEDYWAGDENRVVQLWNGVAALGRVGAPRLKARCIDCKFAVNGFDVVYETGAAIG